jgi:CheY-like chemotaxis protein
MAVLEHNAEMGVVAVIDDDLDQAKTVRFQLEDSGIESLVADLDEVANIDYAVEWIRANAQAVICDVQLGNQHAGVQYNGAQLLSRVIGDHRIPGVLTTGFKDDVGMLVRPHRPRIPVLVSRDETEDPDILVGGVLLCQAEIEHGRDQIRQTKRTALFVEKASLHAEGVALDARVGGWSRRLSMRFPALMLGPDYGELECAQGAVGKVFFAKVNLAATSETELFFEEVEPELVDPANLALHFEEGQ